MMKLSFFIALLQIDQSSKAMISGLIGFNGTSVQNLPFRALTQLLVLLRND